MSATSRPPSRWLTSMSITPKSPDPIPPTIPSRITQRKFFRPTTNTQQTFSQRIAKTKHDIEELFKLYYSNDIKFDTFQQQIVTGTRILSARTSPLVQNHFTNSSTDVFNSKHCVSLEQISNEHQTIGAERKLPTTKRTVQVRLDTNAAIVSSPLSLSPSPRPGPYMAGNSNLIISEPLSSARQDELNESSIVKSVAFLEDLPTNCLEYNNTKRSRSENGHCPVSSKTSLASAPPASPSSFLLMNIRKDSANISHSSFLTTNSVQQQQNQPHIITGRAVPVRRRSSTKPSWCKQRTKSNISVPTNSPSEQVNIRNGLSSIYSPLLIEPDTPETPVFIGAPRVVSIPSKCRRYVVVSFPRTPIRYNTPTYVERLLLPERFPTLFQNIVQSYEHNRNNK